MKKKPLKKIPDFKSEDEERDFWARADLNDYFQKGDFRPAIFPDLKPVSRSISIRVPENVLARLKERANKLNIPYQSLMKQYIARGISGK